MSTLLLKNISQLVTCDDNDRLLTNVDLYCEDGFIKALGPELAVTADALARMRALPHVRILGSDKAEEHNGILTFVVDNVHPHDVSELLAADGVAVRAGHHCAQPLLKHLGFSSTARASFAFYNTEEEADRLIDSLKTLRERMGYGK